MIVNILNKCNWKVTFKNCIKKFFKVYFLKKKIVRDWKMETLPKMCNEFQAIHFASFDLLFLYLFVGYSCVLNR